MTHYSIGIYIVTLSCIVCYFMIQSNWVEICGTVYKISSVAFIRFELDVPVFGRITEVLSVDDQLYLFIKHSLKQT